MFICLYYYRITSVFPFYFSFCDNIIECFCLSFVFFASPISLPCERVVAVVVFLLFSHIPSHFFF